jgi:hypothetical protein
MHKRTTRKPSFSGQAFIAIKFIVSTELTKRLINQSNPLDTTALLCLIQQAVQPFNLQSSFLAVVVVARIEVFLAFGGMLAIVREGKPALAAGRTVIPTQLILLPQEGQSTGCRRAAMRMRTGLAPEVALNILAPFYPVIGKVKTRSRRQRSRLRGLLAGYPQPGAE